MLKRAAATFCVAGALLVLGRADAQVAAPEKKAAAPAAKDAEPTAGSKETPKKPEAAEAEKKTGQPAASSSQQAPQAQGAPTVPEPEALLALIRTTLIALNQANMTGNYTVLRDIGAPGFQAANSAAQLGAAFANIRNQNLDLSPITVVTPQAAEPPKINDQGLLRVVGVFPTRPLQVNFQLLFQPVQGKWRVFGISINASPAPAAAPAAPGPTSAAPPAAAPAKK